MTCALETWPAQKLLLLTTRPASSDRIVSRKWSIFYEKRKLSTGKWITMQPKLIKLVIRSSYLNTITEINNYIHDPHCFRPRCMSLKENGVEQPGMGGSGEFVKAQGPQVHICCRIIVHNQINHYQWSRSFRIVVVNEWSNIPLPINPWSINEHIIWSMIMACHLTLGFIYPRT